MSPPRRLLISYALLGLLFLGASRADAQAPLRGFPPDAPSMRRSSGTVPPAIRAKVGNKSISWTISLLTAPAGILPGHRTAKGTLKAPSKPVNRVPRHGPADP